VLLATTTALVGLAGQATESWQTDVVADAATGVETRIAFVDNTDGFRLSVRPGSGGRAALCSFRLPEDGSDPLARDQRLEAYVDANEPLAIMRWQGPEKSVDDNDDFMEVRRRLSGVVPLVQLGSDQVSFWCWRALKDQSSPASGLLRQILDGGALTVGFGLVEGGEQVTQFSLDGARETISQMLGIAAEPSTRDRAQDELLGFRVHYRSTTCYLLRGKKRWKRCLEGVSRCARQTHASVLSMLECIEGR